jgi:hypothetical protein
VLKTFIYNSLLGFFRFPVLDLLLSSGFLFSFDFNEKIKTQLRRNRRLKKKSIK